MTFRITDDNYEYYKQIFELIWKFEVKAMNMHENSNISPINVLDSWQKENKSLAKRGLKEGLRDSLIMLLDWPERTKQELNEQLLAKGLPNLNLLTAKLRNAPQKVLKRGRIKNLDEYYIIKEFLEGTDSSLSDSERSQLGKILWDFEGDISKNIAT